MSRFLEDKVNSLMLIHKDRRVVFPIVLGFYLDGYHSNYELSEICKGGDDEDREYGYCWASTNIQFPVNCPFLSIVRDKLLDGSFMYYCRYNQDVLEREINYYNETMD